jgi:hypothetical protein
MASPKEMSLQVLALSTAIMTLTWEAISLPVYQALVAARYRYAAYTAAQFRSGGDRSLTSGWQLQ